ncbi:MAG: class I SAM-dependent methyltransferase [Cyclobacteriaceae bacterium]
MVEAKNKIKELLLELGLSTNESIKEFYPSVRDREDVSVYQCSLSKVFLLSSTNHIDFSHYQNKKVHDRKTDIARTLLDSTRRKEELQGLMINKKWLDVGTGAGGVLDQLSPVAAETWAVEPQKEMRARLNELNYQVFETIEEVPDDYFDVISLFHVYEHIITPIEFLQTLKTKLKPGGKIIIEVPHAEDMLLTFLELDAFKKFTFWSEHLILHTRKSLEAFVSKAGLKVQSIQGVQRYPLSNHLHWLKNDKPGGHMKWAELDSDELTIAYANTLRRLNRTDTIMAIIEK